MTRFYEAQEGTKLTELRQKEAEDLTQLLADKHGLPYADLFRMTIDLDALKVIPEAEARKGRIAAFQRVGKTLDIALTNPDPPETQSLLSRLEETFVLRLFLVSEHSLERAFSRYKEIPEFEETQKGIVDVSAERMEEFGSRIRSTADVQQLLLPLLQSHERRKISAVLEALLAGALALDASDIHIEPEEKEVRLRLRLDGVLHELSSLALPIYQLLLSRVKLVSELILNVHERAQDGRFTIRTRDADIEVRASVLPGPYGESVVLRILNPKTIALTLEDLGMHPQTLRILNEQTALPNGMILTTGPTGSGKTTTLYALLKRKRSPGIKIITLENPIEYHLPGITQTQVSPGKEYGFATGLRAILRQDPDVIMVGEIRDRETAETALHASLTGHIVFSTLHTNNAAGTIPRLIDLGAKPNIIAPALNVAMAQRLVRRLCSACKKQRPASREELQVLNRILSGLPEEAERPTRPYALWDPGACAACNNTGYKGRISIAEAFVITDAVERLILKQPTELEIKEVAAEQGMLTMEHDGVLKALAGVTAPEELTRVLGIAFVAETKAARDNASQAATPYGTAPQNDPTTLGNNS